MPFISLKLELMLVQDLLVGVEKVLLPELDLLRKLLELELLHEQWLMLEPFELVTWLLLELQRE